MQVLRLYFIGPFHIALDEPFTKQPAPLTGFGYDKVRALLAFLAVEHHSAHSREYLASLFWPEANPSTSRTNLRKALSTLRKAICSDESNPFLIIRSDSVQFNPKSHFWLDVDQLRARLDAGWQHNQLQYEAMLPDLEEAAALYRGSFLQGLNIDSLEFETWQITIREHLHLRVLSALHELTQYYLRQGAYNLAQKHALRQVELEPYREEAHRALMESLARSGQRSAALAQYERCCALLEDELAVEPSQETQQLYQRIRSAGRARPNNLPVGRQSFVGRQAEQQEIEHLLADPECRLITLVGMGGIGKTSLALKVARTHLEAFWEGIYWIPLTAIHQPDQITNALFDALSLIPGNDPQGQLLDYLREKTVLLLFDNFEQLLALPGDQTTQALQWIENILKHSRYAKLLVTSRQRLGLRAEWLYPVEGLPFPRDLKAKPEIMLEQAAIQLFIRRARQLVPGFPGQESDYQQVARICQLVSGIPLGIELASGWVDKYSCQEIADRIASDLDFLVSELHDQPDRHLSLRAVFDHSWQLLAADLKTILRRLSVFHRSFSRSAGQEIGLGKPHQLTELVHKSWLHQEVGAEYSLHPVLKQFLAEALSKDLVEELEARRQHALYFARFLREREYALTVQYQAAALDEVGSKIGDVLAAWQWAVHHKTVEILISLVEGVFIYYWARNQFAEGLAVFELANASIETLETSHERMLLRARLQVRMADFKYWLGDLELAERLLEANILSLDSLSSHQELAYALELSSRVYYWQGAFEKSINAAQSSIEIARRYGPAHVLAQALNSLANSVCEASSDYEGAHELYTESLAIYRQIENPFGVAKALINKGAIHFECGELARAQQFYLESLQHYRSLNYHYGISVSLNNLGMIARKLGDWEKARALIEESLALKRESGNQVAILHSLLEVGALERDLGHFVEARQHYNEALGIAQEAHAGGLIFNIILAFAELFRQMEEPNQAAELAFWVSRQQEIGQELMAQTEAVLTSLREKLSLIEIERCRQQSQQKCLEDLLPTLVEV